MKRIGLWACLWWLALPAQAFEWQYNALLGQQAGGFKSVADQSRFAAKVFTFEHADGWTYGSNFLFVDMTVPEHGDHQFYGEFSPSLSWKKLFSMTAMPVWLKDVNFTGTWEKGEHTDAKLIGLGMDLNLPEWDLLKLALYQRYSQSDFYPGAQGSAPQLSVVWSQNFSTGRVNWLFEGFMDYAWAEAAVGKTDNVLIQPRMLVDIGTWWDQPRQWWLGVEHSVWYNKYGVKGIDESVTQAAIKWQF
jgi:nucleoside-specific outer membrane channel protein Tsx